MESLATCLTNEIFLDILKETSGKFSEKKLNSLKVERAVGKGENYSSNIFRMIVDYTYNQGADD